MIHIPLRPAQAAIRRFGLFDLVALAAIVGCITKSGRQGNHRRRKDVGPTARKEHKGDQAKEITLTWSDDGCPPLSNQYLVAAAQAVYKEHCRILEGYFPDWDALSEGNRYLWYRIAGVSIDAYDAQFGEVSVFEESEYWKEASNA